VTLHGNFSAPVWVTDKVKVLKDMANLLVCTLKNVFGWGMRIFFDVISGGLLGYLGPLYLALGANR